MYYNTPALFSYSRYWAECYGQADVLPMSRAEMDVLGWDSRDIILVTGDAYIDHPSFGMAVVGRVLEAQGYRVGIIAQPDWRDASAFAALGRPNLFFGVAAGNMDSMINRYTADRLPRSDDAYSPDGRPGLRPDRSTIVYTQRCREAFPDAPIVIGGIEASLRRLAHYDYWEDDIRRSILFDCAADLLVYGNAERQIVEIAQRFARGQSAASMHDLRGVAFLCQRVPSDWVEIDETKPEGAIAFTPPNPYAAEPACPTGSPVVVTPDEQVLALRPAAYYEHKKCVIRLPSFEQVKGDKLLYAHTSRMFHKETNPLNARAVVQRHGNRELWVNPPSLPLTTDEMDWVFGLHYSRLPHPRYGKAKFPAYEMIRFSINIMRGCFGGCTFCSITEHEGRIIQSRSEESIINEIETIRDTVPGFTGVISDLGGPTANMWRMACKTREIESNCRKLSCVFPGICKNLQTDHDPLIKLYRRARSLPGVKKILIASGLRYDLAVESPEYVRELVMHHVGGYLKIAPEHTENAPLSMMMKPGIGSYDKFKTMFEQYTREAGKEQYLIPYFIAGHPGTSDEDMMSLAVWLKTNNFRADQVQTFIPSPMAIASAMYHTGLNPLKTVRRDKERMYVPRALGQRRLQKAFLRYHDPDNWPTLRKALHKLGRADMIGNGPGYLIPATQPVKVDTRVPGAEKHNRQTAHRLLTQHTGLPPAPIFEPKRAGGKSKPSKGRGRKN